MGWRLPSRWIASSLRLCHFAVMESVIHTAHVTTQGRVVIPVALRRKFNIRKDTLVGLIEDGDRLILQPFTRESVRAFRGIYRLKPGEKPATQELLEDRARERCRGSA